MSVDSNTTTIWLVFFLPYQTFSLGELVDLDIKIQEYFTIFIFMNCVRIKLASMAERKSFAQFLGCDCFYSDMPLFVRFSCQFETLFHSLQDYHMLANGLLLES